MVDITFKTVTCTGEKRGLRWEGAWMGFRRTAFYFPRCTVSKYVGVFSFNTLHTPCRYLSKRVLQRQNQEVKFLVLFCFCFCFEGLVGEELALTPYLTTQSNMCIFPKDKSLVTGVAIDRLAANPKPCSYRSDILSLHIYRSHCIF